MTRRRILSFGGLVLLTFLLAVGCTLLVREDSAAGAEWYIKLRIQAPAASKGITVTDFNVTGLNIQVRDPAGEVLQAIDWAAAEGTQTYLVPVKQQGEHQLEVTHFGECNGELVQATESAAFNIQAMKITVIDVVPGCIGVIRMPEQDAPEDGMITVRLIGAEAHDGAAFGFGIVPAGISDPGQALGSGEAFIVNGTAEAAARTPGTWAEIVVFTGGTVVDIGGWIDLDGDDIPSPGEYFCTRTGIKVDGNMLVEFTYPNDFVVLPGSPSDWQLWGTWVNEEYNGGAVGPAAKVVFLESGDVEIYTNVWDLAPFQTFQATITGEWTDEQAHWFQAEVGGPTYVLIRLYDGGNTIAELISMTGYPDPGDLDPSTGNYDVIYHWQQ